MAPQEETFLCSKTFFVDGSNRETQDDGPNQTQNQLFVRVDNILGTNISQINSTLFNKVEGTIAILDFLQAESRVSVELSKGLVSNNLFEVC